MREMLLVLTVITLTGCSFVKTPTARVTEVRVDEATDQGARVLVTVQLDNPNRETELPLPKATYRVALDGSEPFSFVTVPDATLPRGGSIAITLPASFAEPGPLAGRGYSVSGGVSYLPPSEVRELLTDYRWPLPTVNFSESGRLP